MTKNILLLFTLIVFSNVSHAQLGEWPPSDRQTSSANRVVVSDDSIAVFPFDEFNEFYKIYDFSTNFVFINFENQERAIAIKFTELPPEEIDNIKSIGCSRLRPGSEFRRYCN